MRETQIRESIGNLVDCVDPKEKIKLEYRHFIEELDWNNSLFDYERLLETFKLKFSDKDPLIDSSIAYVKIRQIKDKDFKSRSRQEIIEEISMIQETHNKMIQEKEAILRVSWKASRELKTLLKKEIDGKFQMEIEKLQEIENTQNKKIRSLDENITSIYNTIQNSKLELRKFDITMKLFLIGHNSFEESLAQISKFHSDLKNVEGKDDTGIIKFKGFFDENYLKHKRITKTGVRSFMENYPNIDKIKEIIPIFGAKIIYIPNGYYIYTDKEVCVELDAGGGMYIRKEYYTKKVKTVLYK